MATRRLRLRARPKAQFTLDPLQRHSVHARGMLPVQDDARAAAAVGQRISHRRRQARRERGRQRAQAQDGPRRVSPAAVRRQGGRGRGQEGEGGARLEGRGRGRLHKARQGRRGRDGLASREAGAQAPEARQDVAARRCASPPPRVRRDVGQDVLENLRDAPARGRPTLGTHAPRSHPARPHREGVQRPAPLQDARARRREEGFDKLPRRRPEGRGGHELDARVLERASGAFRQDRGEGGERVRAPVRPAAVGGRSGEGAEEVQEEVPDVRARYW